MYWYKPSIVVVSMVCEQVFFGKTIASRKKSSTVLVVIVVIEQILLP